MVVVDDSSFEVVGTEVVVVPNFGNDVSDELTPGAGRTSAAKESDFPEKLTALDIPGPVPVPNENIEESFVSRSLTVSIVD